MAERPDQGEGADTARHPTTDSDPNGDEPKVLLASVKNTGNPNRTDKRLVGETRATVVKRDVGIVPLSVGSEGRHGFRDDGLIVRNRRMRTRLSGGGGGVALGPRAWRPPIPIGLAQLNSGLAGPKKIR